MAKDQGTERVSILLAEDNPADVFLVREALTERGLNFELVVVTDGEEASRTIQHLDSNENLQCPNLVLLDLNLPKKDGEEILRQMRQSRRCREIPVVILTSSDSPKDRAVTESLGATRYFRKPSNLDDFMQVGGILDEVLRSSPPARNPLESSEP
ncbi:MAG: response regulator [Bryobacteraceae bacterium]